MLLYFSLPELASTVQTYLDVESHLSLPNAWAVSVRSFLICFLRGVGWLALNFKQERPLVGS